MDANLARFDFIGLTQRAPDVTFSERYEIPVGVSKVVVLEAKHSHAAAASVTTRV